MNYSQFIIKVKEGLQERLGAEVKVEAIHVPKNNGVVLQGITVRRPEEKVVPTIYMERFYEDYLEGRDMDDILEEFMEIYEEQETAQMPDFAFYQDYEKVKRRLALKLVNRKKNAAMLVEMPSRDFLDMAVTFYCLVDCPQTGTAAILIKNTHMEKWGITVERLYEDALKNAERMLPGSIRTMEEMLSRLVLEEDIPAWEWKEKEQEDFPMLDGFAEKRKAQEGIPLFILTNSRRYFGAACILYRGLLERFAEKTGKSLYILPSSIHEVILLPEDCVKKADHLIRMVSEVNRTQLEPEEVLSDAVYYYDREKREISICHIK